MKTDRPHNEIYCAYDRNDPRPIVVYGISPIDAYRLTEREAWELLKTLAAALQGYNQKPGKL
jgi:hypothetical protein